MSMDLKSYEEKNAKIAQSYKETRERRLTQTCKVIEIKVDQSRLTSAQRNAVPRVFLEAKWLYNEAISQDDIYSYVLGKTVNVKTFSGEMEEREFCHLSVQARQGVIEGAKSNIKSLSALKENGHKTGALKHVRRYDSVNYKQPGKSYKVDRDTSKIKIQNIPGWIHVHGVDQITDDMEMANARFVQKASGYYLYVTVFIDKDLVIDDYVPGTVIGIDMGVSSHLTLSSGEKIKSTVPETKRLKRLQRSLERQRQHAKVEQKTLGLDRPKMSKNYYKTLDKVRLEYEKMDRKKDEIARQVCARILENEYVFYQDEMLSGWKVRFGKQIHHSILGRVKSILARSDRAYMLDKSVATTQYCPMCGNNTKHDLSKRIYTCGTCGHTADRDIHASDNMPIMGSKRFNIQLPTDRGEVTPVPITRDSFLMRSGIMFSGVVREDPRPLPSGNSSEKQEAHRSLDDG